MASIRINKVGLDAKVNNSAIESLIINKTISDIYMIPCYGQSLSNNGAAGPSTFSSPVSIAYDTSLTNTNIQDMNGGYAEMFLSLSADRGGLPANFKMMTCLGGGGGKSVLQLSNPSTFFTTLMNNIQEGKNTADTNGLSYNVPAFMWTQGEEDYRTDGVISNWGIGDWNPLEYANKLSNLIDDIDAGVKSITGQTNDVKCIMYQTGSHNFYRRYPVIAHQQLQLALVDERVTLAKTMYDVDYNTADYVHAPSKTYRNMGNHYGVALYKTTVLNQRVLPLHVIDHIVDGNNIYLNCYVPFPPLVLDITLVQPLPDGNYGFQLYDVINEDAGTSGTINIASVTITSVTLEDSNTIKIICSGSPIGRRLTYAINGDYWQNIAGTLVVSTGGEGPNGQAKSGRTYGSRGNVRDSSPYENSVVDYLHLYNWMPIFEIEL